MPLLLMWLMKSTLLKAVTIFWLLLVLPALGLLPLLLMFDVLDPSELGGRLALAMLRDVRGIILSDPAPENSHLYFHDLAPQIAWVVLMIIVFCGAGLSVYYWWRLFARRAA